MAGLGEKMILSGDRVPMYKVRANKGLLWTAVFVLIVGGLLSAHFYIEDSYASASSRGLLTLLITITLALLLVISATAHFWFRHLWHHRPGYKRG